MRPPLDRYHANRPDVLPPDIAFRTCLVLHAVPKKNALDDVFWLAVYNMTLKGHEGDTRRCTSSFAQ